MNPIPLAAPDGRVYAYACGVCHEAHAGAHHLIQPKEPGPSAELIDGSLADAARCCACGRCGARLAEARYGHCAPCGAIVQAEQETASAAAEIAHRSCVDKQQASLERALDRDAACRLVGMMRDLSEDGYCAGWMGDLEFDLWSIALGRESSDFGLSVIAEDTLAELRRLSERSGGWWVWIDGAGELFMPIAEWRALYLLRRPPKMVVVRSVLADGTPVGLYEGEVCGAGTCGRPPGHVGLHDAFDGPLADDHVPMHRLLPEETSP